ncbi:flagellar assembly protein FliW [Paenibacillus spiritus]|uniref:Flagellar assembly factor FliW n=1 Tax=Paenibacillus spiritus TaxID=2496557 RepID=A0A5J5FY49_9BACL|nr:MULTISPECIES: flagellar assembly protein FliW [Paenibacillus]KAA8997984.1 flagellar assembly protein FliW [Paenibacillus spiritus]
MKVETTAWGTLEIEEEQLLSLPKSLPGFDDITNFALLPAEQEPFYYLQSLDNADLCFLLQNPFYFFPDYQFNLPDDEAEELEITDQTGVEVYCITTVRSSIKESTANLLAPLVVNPAKRVGKQVVLHQSGYQTRQPIWISEPDKPEEGGV